jgi:hypothetical protein
LLIDTYLISAHFGHVGSRAVQSRLVLEELNAAGQGTQGACAAWR